jgi:hypothetical protein
MEELAVETLHLLQQQSQNRMSLLSQKRSLSLLLLAYLKNPQ